MANSRSQQVWLSGEAIGRITSRSRTSVAFEYNNDVLERYPLNTPLLSCSLPTRRGKNNARAFFAGLLPEGDHRRFLAEQAGCLSSDVFALLETFGRDVAGAVWIGDEPPSATSHSSAQPGNATYSRDALENEVAGLDSRPLAIYDDSALSIAGIQNKMLLVQQPDGSWARPIAGYPSTHILKVDDRRHAGLVRAEDTCLAIAQAAGIPAANSRIEVLAGIDCIIVERFDRRVDGERVSRVHQEDACQALGVDLEGKDPRAKYEANGGPSLRNVAALLNGYSQESQVELLRLLEQLVFTVAIGNADHHAKNISFLHTDARHITLAPLYDTIPTGLWPTLDSRAAMSIGAAVDIPDIDSQDLIREARAWGLPESITRDHLRDTLERLQESSHRVPDSGQLDVTSWVQRNTTRLLASLQRT
jgi:serine/threonine-protein kinase HipA